MLMSHSPLDQEIEFFNSFLTSAINGDEKYKAIVTPLLEDAQSLAKKDKTVYQLSKEPALNLIILIDSLAHKWLLKVNVSAASDKDLKELQTLINDKKNYADA